MDEVTWLTVVADAQSWNKYRAQQFLSDPALERNKVERAKKISRLLYGLPWWLREAHFWREAKGEGKEQHQSSAPIPALDGNETLTPQARAQGKYEE
jgi:hypothetical protein